MDAAGREVWSCTWRGMSSDAGEEEEERLRFREGLEDVRRIRLEGGMLP